MIRTVIFLGLLAVCLAQTTTTTPPTTTTKPKLCNSTAITDCDKCVQVDVKCLWCNANKKCMDYPVHDVLPKKSTCPLGDARWGVCWLNFEALIISCSIIAGLLLIGITLCFCKCCGCCCFKKNRSAYAREEARLEIEREARKMRQDERRKERKARNDEIRRKYGLATSEPKYQKFEND